jgi:nicotinamidase-related amidase
MNNRTETVTHIVVDMLYDFIDGSLACTGGEEAVEKVIEHINNHPEERVVYVCDSHPANHCSFVAEGGIWPPHCVSGTHGGDIHRKIKNDIVKAESRPTEENSFLKGYLQELEQYSGYEAVNKNGTALSSVLSPKVVISGIATEFCVLETVSDLIRNGFDVTVNTQALAYVTKEGHETALEKFREAGIKLI